MVPPPITPNPHRFILSTPSSTRPSEQRASSSLHAPQDSISQAVPSIAKNFAGTPRFTFSSSNREREGNANPNQYRHDIPSPFEARRYLPKPAPPQKEIIDEPSFGEDDAGAGLYPQPLNVKAKSVSELHEDEPSSPPPAPSAKRLRPPVSEGEQIVISSSPAATPPSSAQLPSSPSPPTTPPPPALHALSSASKPHSRFRLPTQTSPGSTAPKPVFILPPPAAPESDPSAHLSSLLFSPRKRNPKFVPGGAAATVREWVIEASQPIYSSRQHSAGEDWEVKFRIGEARHVDSWFLVVRTQTSPDGEGAAVHGGKKWVLIGKGDGERPGVGDMVGIRRPVWDVDVGREEGDDKEAWSVAVEWKTW